MAARTPRISLLRKLLFTLVLLACALAMLRWWVALGRPAPIADGPERLECLSYAPYRDDGSTPFNPGTKIARARIAEDLRLLSVRTACVRTYSTSQGLDVVPEEAARLGMTVLLGAWIGRDRIENEAELGTAIALANAFPSTVRALIVGNEVLLRRELPPAELALLIERARRGTNVPVTYADVWEFWNRNAALAASVSFVTIHILPYWEDDPIAIDAAVGHVLEVWRRMQGVFAGKKIMIGETGWPSAGRARRAAVPSLVNQARFVREFARAAQLNGMSYNLVEAFDQPWKRALEGAMGGNWGVYDRDGKPKFAATGPVLEDAHWRDGILAVAIGALAGLLLAGRVPAPRRTPLTWLDHVLLGAASGAVVFAQWRYMWQWNRFPFEWFGSALCTALLIPTAVAAAAAAAREDPRLAAPGIARLLSWRRRGTRRGSSPLDRRDFDALAYALGALRFFWLFATVTMLLLLAADARYRGFDWPLFALPSVAFALLAWLGMEPISAEMREERLLAMMAVPLAVIVMIEERIENLHAIGFVGLLIVLVAAMTGLRFGLRWTRSTRSGVANQQQ